MLIYDNRAFCKLIFLRWGSIFWRHDVVVIAVSLAAVALIIQFAVVAGAFELFEHHYGILAIGGIVGIATVFRTNFGWQRYWEACSQLHFMYSKWTDAFTLITAFAMVTIEQTEAKGGDASQAKMERVRRGLTQLEANFSLMSALAAHRLSNGDTEHMTSDDWVLMRHDLRKKTHMCSPMPQFKAWSQKRASSGSRLFVEKQCENKSQYLVSLDPSEQKLDALENSSDRVNMAMFWVVHELARLSKDIDTAPPIQSRMYQELSNGMLGFNNALKIADVPFPFPYSQLMTVLLVVFMLFIPVYMVAFTKSYIAAPLMTFLFVEGVWGLNQVAIELENPFGHDVNDISLADFHDRFMQSLQECNEAHNVVLAEQVEENQQQVLGLQSLDFSRNGEITVLVAEAELTAMAPKDLPQLKETMVAAVTSTVQGPAVPEQKWQWLPASSPALPPALPGLPPKEPATVIGDSFDAGGERKLAVMDADCHRHLQQLDKHLDQISRQLQEMCFPPSMWSRL